MATRGRYDLLVIDLDGTLLRRDGSVSQRNVQAVAAARHAGIQVIIATGRALIESREALAAINHNTPGDLVAAAGVSLLGDAAPGRKIDRAVWPADLVRDATRSLLEDGHKALILKDAHATGYDYLAVGSGEL